MLRVIGHKNVVSTQTVCDEDYVPLTFRQLTSSYIVPLYWLSGDRKTQVIEIGLDPYDSSILNVVVAGFGSIKKNTTIEENTYDEIVQGVPQCDLSRWPLPADIKAWTGDRFVTEETAFNAVVLRSSLAIYFSGTNKLRRGYQAGEIIFGEDDTGSLACIEYKPANRDHLTYLLKMFG